MPAGPVARGFLDEKLLTMGLVSAAQLGGANDEEEEEDRWSDEPRQYVLTFAEKLKVLFDFDFPAVQDVRIQPVWAAGELLEFDGKFNNFITAKHLQKQEGLVFRHILRLILLLGEFMQLCPPEVDQESWRERLQDLSDRLTESCRNVDPRSTEQVIEQVATAQQPRSD